jgi:hypothetical protein
MPLDFVTSNAGHPMLIIDRYTFHKHCFNPKTGRTNWRCSRRRVKDIRCPSSCFSASDRASVPSAHDPNCQPLTNSELISYRIRADKLNNQIHKVEPTEPIDLSDEYKNYNADSFDREVDSDEEELNDVLNDLYDTSENLVVKREEFDQTSDLEKNNDGNEDHNNEYNTNVGGDVIENINEHENSVGSVEQTDELMEPSNTISSIIESNKKLLNHIKSQLSSFMESQAQNSSSSSTTSSNNNKTKTKKWQNTTSSKSIYFVTSKVGHPMLVVDNYTFHKHSTNPKTSRINWRCARRRVKDIRCSSSCYTVDGVVSAPTDHDAKCYPLTDEMLKVYQNKRAKVLSSKSFGINTKAESFTTLKSKQDFGGNETDNNMQSLVDDATRGK